jgi:plastocyanin
MIFRLRTCFSCIVLASILLSPKLACAGAITGAVDLVASRHSVARSRRDSSGVVVWLQPLSFDVAPPSPKRVKMVQKDKRFEPHVLTVETGTTVDFPNFDPIFHNAFSNFSGQLFDVGLYPPGSSQSIRFERPGVVRVFCNIHPTMSALIVVLNSPYFTSTDKNGHFRIPAVPPGDYELHVFHERALPETLQGLTHSITVTASPLEIPTLKISEAGYLPMPHKNKYGHAYPPAPDDQGAYSSPLQ